MRLDFCRVFCFSQDLEEFVVRPAYKSNSDTRPCCVDGVGLDDATVESKRRVDTDRTRSFRLLSGQRKNGDFRAGSDKKKNLGNASLLVSR